MKLLIDRSLKQFCNQKRSILAEFCVFCADELSITGDFSITLTSDRQKHNIATTAAYASGLNECYVYCKKRAMPDVMRSIAHEMTHMMQDQSGLLVGNIRDIGGFHEDQANARAGELLKKFAKVSGKKQIIYEKKI